MTDALDHVRGVIADLDRQVEQCIQLKGFLMDLYGLDRSTAARKDVRDRKMGAEEAAASEVAATASPETLGQASPMPAGTQAPPVDTNSEPMTGEDTPEVVSTPASGVAIATSTETTIAEGQQISAGGPEVDAAGQHEAGADAAPSAGAGDAGDRDADVEPDAEAPPAHPKRRTAKVADPLSLASRIRALNAEHPEYTGTQAAQALGIDRYKMQTNSSANGIKWASERAAKSKQPSQEARPPAPTPTPEPEPDRPPVDKPVVEKRNDNAAPPAIVQQIRELNDAEPSLDVYAAAERLGVLPIVLRSYSAELGITWAQPATGKAMPDSVAQPQMMTLRAKVRVMHQHHPEWTAKMIADELGANNDSVLTYLIEARKIAKAEAPPAEPFVGEAALRQHYADTRKRLGATS